MMKYTHPFNVITLMLGVMCLILGAIYAGAPDWDIPISIIMALFCYLFATPTVEVILDRKWHLVPIVALLTWWTVDGCYVIYWIYTNPDVLVESRQANWPASLSLYLAAGVVWLIPSIIGSSRKKDPSLLDQCHGNRE